MQPIWYVEHAGADIVSSIPGACEFATACKRTAAPQPWKVLVFAVQISELLHDQELNLWACEIGATQPVVTEVDEGYMRLVLGDCPENGMRVAGLAGHYIAARIAEHAYLADNLPLLEKAVLRLSIFPTEASQINPATERILYDALLDHMRHGHIQIPRLQQASEQLAPRERQRLWLDWNRLRNRVHMGGTA